MGELLKPGMFVALDDLDSGYWHLALHPESYQFCGNSCTDPKTGKLHFFQWKVLFLGITSAVTVFTRITKPIKIYLRLKCGIILLIYIDDLMVAARTYEECLYMKFFAVDVLARAGWVINLDKGQMPSQAAVYLGFVLDTENMVFLLPEEKVAKILDHPEEVTAQGAGGGFRGLQAPGRRQGLGAACEGVDTRPLSGY